MQKVLLEQLIGYAERLDIQIVATTHSLTLLESACRRFKANTKIVYLKKVGSSVVVSSGVDYDEIAFDLALVEQKSRIESHRTTILFEDWVAATFFSAVTKNLFKDLKDFLKKVMKIMKCFQVKQIHLNI